jgi:hypothetical protein
MTRDPARDADGNVSADHPRAYHHRDIAAVVHYRSGNVTTTCGRRVNYQQTMTSWDDIDCRSCLAARPSRQLRLDLSGF